jgi:hypothetical protein
MRRGAKPYVNGGSHAFVLAQHQLTRANRFFEDLKVLSRRQVIYVVWKLWASVLVPGMHFTRTPS